MPAVEKKNVQLLLQMSADRKKVAELEADILKRLSEAQGNILDDEDLINTLAESKKVSIMIGKRMEAAVVTKQEIDEAREAYRTVATRGSIIYFVIADMVLTQRPSRHRRASSLGEQVVGDHGAPRMTWSPRRRRCGRTRVYAPRESSFATASFPRRPRSIPCINIAYSNNRRCSTCA